MYRIVTATVPARQAYYLHAFSERGWRWAFGSDDASVADEVLRSVTDLLLIDAAALGEQGARIARGVRRIGDMDSLPVLAILQESAITPSAGIFWDEFVLEPLRQGELVLRIGLLLAKRRGGTLSRVSVGAVTVDYEKYEVTRDGRRVSLTYKEHELLRFLAGNPDKAFTREALLDRVWGGDYIGGVRTVDVHVRRLRAKMGDLRGKTIETVRGVGYRFQKSFDGRET